MTGETLKLTPSESVTVRESTPDALEVEVVYGPGGEPPPAHWHPSQEERFEVVGGAVHTRIGGEESVRRPGDTFAIPRGAVHQIWNPDPEPARMTWKTIPRLRTHDWFAAIDALHRQGRVGSGGMPGPLAYAVLLTEYRDVFRLAAKPERLVSAALALLAPIGRMRGYSPRA